LIHCAGLEQTASAATDLMLGSEIADEKILAHSLMLTLHSPINKLEFDDTVTDACWVLLSSGKGELPSYACLSRISTFSSEKALYDLFNLDAHSPVYVRLTSTPMDAPRQPHL
jgi:hypothetical protein